MTVTTSYADYTIYPLMVLGYDYERQAGNIVHDTILDQAVTLRKAGLRKGTLTFLFADEASALDAEDAHALPEVFTLTDTDRPGLNMRYVVAGTIRTTLDPQTRHRWTLAVTFRQVR